MQSAISSRPAAAGRAKFWIGGLLIVAAIVYLIVSSTAANAQYFLTIDEMMARSQAEMGARDVRVSGAVDGNTIQFDSSSLTLTFEVANIPGDQKVIDQQGGLAAVLHAAVTNPAAGRVKVLYKGPKPDLLKNEAQAIMTGRLGTDGVFTATELLLKCPTKYEEAVPNQAEN
jgi:cytochrome c-type biogenesis protein CcmE